MDDLDDPVVRGKLTDVLPLITPLLTPDADIADTAPDEPSDDIAKASWADFHKKTDEMAAHFAPQIAAALRGVIPNDRLRHAIRKAYTSVNKAAVPIVQGQGVPPQRGTNPAATAAAGSPAATGMGTGAAAGAALGAAPAALGAAGIGIAAGPTAAAASAAVAAGLVAGGLLTAGLVAVLAAVYAAAIAQGGTEASDVSGGTPTAGTNSAQVSDGAGAIANGIADTLVNRVAATIAKDVAAGVSTAQCVADCEAVIADMGHATLIADTEFTRGLIAGILDTYRAAGVGWVAWAEFPDACSLCQENNAVSPVRIGASWPNGSVPVHPSCRCAIVPSNGPGE